MKKKLTLVPVVSNQALDKSLKDGEETIMNGVVKNAKHYASKNMPTPEGDRITPYVEGIKTECEHFASRIQQEYFQSQTHIPEAKIKIEQAEKELQMIIDAILHLSEQNCNDRHNMNDHITHGMWNKVFLALVFSGIILVGEIALNMKAFEYSGENKLFALILAVAFSFAVYFSSHMLPLIYKEISLPSKKRHFFIVSMIVMTIVFIAIAIIRSYMLSQLNVSISPVIFVVLNLFLFGISALISYALLPKWNELKEYYHNQKFKNEIQKREKQIVAYGARKMELEDYVTEIKTQVIRFINYSETTNKRIEKFFFDCVAKFKTVNISNRIDRKVPDCFHQETPQPDINNLTISVIYNNINNNSK